MFVLASGNSSYNANPIAENSPSEEFFTSVLNEADNIRQNYFSAVNNIFDEYATISNSVKEMISVLKQDFQNLTVETQETNHEIKQIQDYTSCNLKKIMEASEKLRDETKEKIDELKQKVLPFPDLQQMFLGVFLQLTVSVLVNFSDICSLCNGILQHLQANGITVVS